MKIKAIETRYAGCRFRSRLEARWAVFFDTVGWSWEYEPEGFELPSGRYLPDFRVKGIPRTYGTTWVEIKPGPFPGVHVGEFVSYDPPQRADDGGMDVLDPRWVELCGESDMMFVFHGLWREGEPSFRVLALRHIRCVDPACSACRSGVFSHVILDPHYRDWVSTEDYRVRAAFEAATSARFEFGETGR